MTTPSRRDRTKPAELLALSGVFAVFTGLIVLMSTRELVPALIFTCVAFILSLVMLAMLALTMKPNKGDIMDLDEQDRQGH